METLIKLRDRALSYAEAHPVVASVIVVMLILLTLSSIF